MVSTCNGARLPNARLSCGNHASPGLLRYYVQRRNVCLTRPGINKEKSKTNFKKPKADVEVT